MAVMQEHELRMQLNAERAVIGAVLIDENIVRDVLSCVDAGDFLEPVNRLIYQAARKLFRDGAPVDPVTIRNQIGADYTDYLVQLMEMTPTSANWREYAEDMRQQTALQRVRDLADQLMGAPNLDGCREAIAELGQLMGHGRKVDTWNTREMLDDFYVSQDPEVEAPEYITTGIEVIDQGTYTELGDVIVVGGEPSSGKTALALMMAYHMAKTHRVGFFSLETAKKKVRDRMVAHMAQVDFNAIKRRTLSERDWTAVAAKGADFAKRDLTVLQASGMTATEIQAVSQAYGFQIIFIDYVQLIVPESDRKAIRSEQMAEVSRSLHTFAQKSGTLVVELAQIARMDRSSGWREADMHDLKESGQFEQDADVIYMLFRPNPKNEDGLDEERHRILKVAKNKEYRRGKWPLYFDGAKQTFSTIVDSGDERSKQVLRELQAAGKAARNKNHVEGQVGMDGFREIRKGAKEARQVFQQEGEKV